MERMKRLLFFSLGIAALFLLSGCASETEEGGREKGVSLSIGQQNVWVNLMPGTKPTFHCTGVVLLYNTTDKSVSDITLTEIEVFQKDEKFFTFTPIVERTDQKGGVLESQTEAIYNFTSPDEIAIEDLNLQKPVKLKLYFKTSLGTLTITGDDTVLLKAY